MSPNLNRLLLTLLIVGAVITIPLAAADKTGPVGWSDNFEQAKAQAQKTGLPILADFTGSDWCGWCIRLKAEVFDTPMFKEWAAANVVLLELDFPNTKPQSAQLRKQNQELAMTYGIRGYPTILILDADGNKLGELGYLEGGPKSWINAFSEKYNKSVSAKSVNQKK